MLVERHRKVKKSFEGQCAEGEVNLTGYKQVLWGDLYLGLVPGRRLIVSPGPVVRCHAGQMTMTLRVALSFPPF